MRVLVVKTSSLGDILHAYPVIAYLKERHAVIEWVVEDRCRELIEEHPDITRAWVISTRCWRKGKNLASLATFYREFSRKRFDLVIDLQGNLKSACFTFLAKSPVKIGWGWKTAPEKLNTFATNRRYDPVEGKNIREDLLYLVQSYFGDFSIPNQPISQTPGKGTLVCPGAHWKTKRLPLETLKKVVKLCPEPVSYIWGTDEEKQICLALAKEKGELLPKLSLWQLRQEMLKRELVVAMDSLPLHLAATTSVATWSFFGPSSASKYKPMGEQHQALQGVCPYGVEFSKRCPQLRTCKTGSCLTVGLKESKLLPVK